MATGAAAAIARARRDVQHYFFSHDAVRPERAVPFEADRMIEQRQFERMKAKGIIREAGPGTYWLDVVVYDADLCTRYARVKAALLVVLLILVVVVSVLPLVGVELLTAGH